MDILGEIQARANHRGYMTFPREHRQKLHSTNPIERLHAEIKRRTNVVGIFPNDDAITRLVGAVLLEQNDEWAVARRYMTLEAIAPVPLSSRRTFTRYPSTSFLGAPSPTGSCTVACDSLKGRALCGYFLSPFALAYLHREQLDCDHYRCRTAPFRGMFGLMRHRPLSLRKYFKSRTSCRVRAGLGITNGVEFSSLLWRPRTRR